MNTKLERPYIYEKKVFKNLIINTRILEITYSENFNLIFYKTINISKGDNFEWIMRKMNLIIDAPFWVGDREDWEKLIKNESKIVKMNNEKIAYELVNIKYNNLIQVNNVEFLEKYLCISLDDEKILSIAYYSDSDYSWILEEYNDKSFQEKMMVFCQGNQLFAKNIPSKL